MSEWQQQLIADTFQNYQNMLMQISLLLVTGGVILLLTKEYTKNWKILGVLGVAVAVFGIVINHHIYSLIIERLKVIADNKGSILLETQPNQCLSLGGWYVFQIICNSIAAIILFIILLTAKIDRIAAQKR